MNSVESVTEERNFLHAIATPLGAISFLLEIQSELIASLDGNVKQAAELKELSEQLNEANMSVRNLLNDRRAVVKKSVGEVK